jgi:hypothetical protein
MPSTTLDAELEQILPQDKPDSTGPSPRMQDHDDDDSFDDGESSEGDGDDDDGDEDGSDDDA